MCQFVGGFLKKVGYFHDGGIGNKMIVEIMLLEGFVEIEAGGVGIGSQEFGVVEVSAPKEGHEAIIVLIQYNKLTGTVLLWPLFFSFPRFLNRLGHSLRKQQFRFLFADLFEENYSLVSSKQIAIKFGHNANEYKRIIKIYSSEFLLINIIEYGRIIFLKAVFDGFLILGQSFILGVEICWNELKECFLFFRWAS